MIKDKHLYRESVDKKGFRIVNCLDCGYWHVNPMPTEEELNDFYKTKYYETLGDNRTMIDKKNDPDGFFSMMYDDRLRNLARLLPAGLPRSVLDLGAGYGGYLRFMRQNGWETQGLELSRQTWDSITDKDRLGIRHGSVKEIKKAGFKKASVITFINVLEHLIDPREALNMAKEDLLLPRGLICAMVPNDFSLLQGVVIKDILKSSPEDQHYWVSPPEHLNYWTQESIKGFLERCGFEVIYMTGDFPIEMFLLMGDDYITDPEIGKRVHLKRVNFEKHFHKKGLLDMKEALFKSFADLRMSRSIIVFASAKKAAL